jgi:hypothetical protein
LEYRMVVYFLISSMMAGRPSTKGSHVGVGGIVL